MTSAHDWFADCAENYTAFLFARSNNFAVFGSGKWEADVVIQNKITNKWLRIEVRSSSVKKKPLRKKPSKLKDKADILTEIILKDNVIHVKFNKLTEGKKTEHLKSLNDPNINEMESWLKQNFDF